MLRASCAATNASTQSSETVPMLTDTIEGRPCLSRSPSMKTSRRAWSFGSIETTASPRKASAAFVAMSAPARLSSCNGSDDLSHARTWCPAFSRFAAMALPIRPVPRNPTSIVSPLLLRGPLESPRHVVRLSRRASPQRDEGCSATCAVTPTSVGWAISVAHDEAAVDVDRLARHVIGVAAREKAHDASHVLGSLRPAEGDKRGSPLPGLTHLPALEFTPFGVDLPPHRRVDRAGADAIRRDPMGRQHLRRSARDADDAGFAGRVVRHQRQAASVGGNRCGLDQLSAQLGTGNRRLLTHAFGGGLQHEKDGAQVDRQHAVPLVRSELEQRPDFGNAGVVEQHVEPPPALVGEIEHALDVRRAGHVDLDGGLSELVGKGLDAVAIDIRQQQLRAVARHAPPAGGADATRSARDERMNTVEPIGHLVPWEDSGVGTPSSIDKKLFGEWALPGCGVHALALSARDLLEPP